MTTETLDIEVVRPFVDPAHPSIERLLSLHDLTVDPDIEVFAIARDGRRVIACLGLARGVLKCAAVAPDEMGGGLSARLVDRLRYEALDRGRHHLFAYTKPANRRTFENLGFHAIAEVPGLVTLLEDTPFGVTSYARSLQRHHVAGERVGAVVLNANPFTLGHQHLVRTAADDCDVLHVFVVGEDASLVPYRDRLALVRAGVAALPCAGRVHVHEGSRYVVSRATFPGYFLKDAARIVQGAAGLDLQLFRRHIAPALGVRHRYVGTEPLSAITALYNDEMPRWLTAWDAPEPPIDVHVVERIAASGAVVSATRVRAAIEGRDAATLASLVPPTTLDYIENHLWTAPPNPKE